MASERRKAKQMISKGYKILDELDKQEVPDDEGTTDLDFDLWFRRLLKINMTHNQFGWQHPTGTCAYRDVLRSCRDELKKAYLEEFKDMS
jgi:hypothetical protein